MICRRDRTAEVAPSSVLPLLVLALSLSSIFPSCSAAANTQQKQPPGKKGSPSPLPSQPSVEIGRSFSSVIFPIHGNVYPDGLYFVSLSIGEPPKPYFLDVDTGSDLTWLQCDAPCVRCSKGPHPLYKPIRNKLIPCKDPLCESLRSNSLQGNGCESASDQCDYEIEYADQGSSLGVLITDAFSMRFVNGSLPRRQLAFGCGYDNQGSGATSPHSTDGVLGLGHGKSSIPSQLRDQGLTLNVIGHCLSRSGGGFLFFGDDLVPRRGMTWTPMSRSVSSKNYSPGPANLFFNKQSLGSREFPVVFDSGSSYTYFASQAYEVFLSKLRQDLSGKPLKEAFEDRTLPLCWKGTKPFKSVLDVSKYFKPLTLSFVNRKRAQLEIPPEGYLINTKYGNVCLGILNGTAVGLKDLNIIGDISLQNLMVVYDNEKGQIGWARANCDRLPNADSDSGLEADFYHPHHAIFPEQCRATYNLPTI